MKVIIRFVLICALFSFHVKSHAAVEFVAKRVAKGVVTFLTKVETVGINFSICEFYDRNENLVISTDHIYSCVLEKLKHDLSYKLNGEIRLLIENSVGEKTWASLVWEHAKLKNKSDSKGLIGRVGNIQIPRIDRFYRMALENKINIIFDSPMSFSVKKLPIHFLSGVREISADFSVKNKKSKNLIGKWSIADDYGLLRGKVVSNATTSKILLNIFFGRKSNSKISRSQKVIVVGALQEREINELPTIDLGGLD